MSIIPLGGFQLPFQKRLSRLYNDTKKSSEFVKEPVQNAEDPEIKALHRKLRIQKDRLVTWGVEWSDPNQSAEIDESLSKAGLSEVVGSVMSTIKDILAEAEPLWQSYKGEGPAAGAGGGGSRDSKKPAPAWDRRRFEDLVRDLTASIDTLYDLSRTRSTAMAFRGGPGAAAAAGAAPSSGKPSGGDDPAKVFESTRMETPHQIDPSSLIPLANMHAASDDATLDLSRAVGRDIVVMSKQAFAETHPTDPSQWAPLLLEFAAFDSIYSTTGIMPPMSRFERLSAGLQRGPQRSPGTWTGLPRLLGYFEDMERSRLGLVYQFPPAFSPVSFDPQTQRASAHFVTLRELLARPDYEPRLEAKFRMAHNLANTVFDMHTRGVTHGNLVDGSVAFCTAIPEDGRYGEPDVRRPLVTSFDLFPDTPSGESSASLHPLFHHPLDPYVTDVSPLAGQADLRVLDLYSLAMILLSIGLWTSVENLVPDPRNASPVSESVLDKLAIRCGTLYMKAVETCWLAVEEELAGRGAGEEVLARVQGHVSRCLEACCIIDGVSDFAARVRDEEGSSGEAAPEGRAREEEGWPGASTRELSFKMPGAFEEEEKGEQAGMDAALAALQEEWKHEPRRVDISAALMADIPVPLRVVPEQRMARAGDVSVKPEDASKRSILARLAPAESTSKASPGLMVQQAKPVMPQVSRQVAKMGSRVMRYESATSPSPQPVYPFDRPEPMTGGQSFDGASEKRQIMEADRMAGVYDTAPPRAEPKRERLRLYPHVEIPPEAIDKWNKVVMPGVNAALRQFYRKHPESVEISLEAVGPSAQAAIPTVLVVCTSVGKVRGILSRKMSDLFDGTAAEFGLKVCRGRVVRSRGDAAAANAEHQERPLNGASIGAWVGYDHLPPVSFGGLVIVDDKPYGMTVHHMLDDPDCVDAGSSPPLRAAATAAHGYQFGAGESASEEGSEEYSCEFSDEDSEAEYSDTEPTSDEEDEDDEDDDDGEYAEPGDIPGVEPGCGDGYIITQPAFDDVDEGFYPEAGSAAEDHVDSFGLGTMYASSGIRRREQGGLIHEVDWALFEFNPARLPETNSVPRIGREGGKGRGKGKGKGGRPRGDSGGGGALSPTSVASTASLPGLEVQCVARTSGGQTGRIHGCLTSVKIFGRQTPSHTYQVSGEGGAGAGGDGDGRPGSGAGRRILGAPGDSGAWLVDGEGRVCGHVLAWSQRKRVAYICPMDVLLLDIAERLEAREVRLPGGEAVVTLEAGWGEWEGDDGGVVGEVERGVAGMGVGEREGQKVTGVAVDGGVARSRALRAGDGGPLVAGGVGGGGGGGGGGGVDMAYLSEKMEDKGGAGCPVVCVETGGYGGGFM